MRALLLSAAVLFAVNAEATPDGCYVAFDNPAQCYTGTIDVYYASEANNVYHYGFTVGKVVSSLYKVGADYTELTSDFHLCTQDYSAKSAEFNTCANNYLGLYNYSQLQGVAVSKLNRQIKTLKRKCGTRCR